MLLVVFFAIVLVASGSSGSSVVPLFQGIDPTNASNLDPFIDVAISRIKLLPFPCEPPEISTDDGQLDCMFTKDKMTCNHTCAKGYTHEDGPSREMTCLIDENIWRPEYKLCEPFKKCSLILTSTGKYTCARSDFFGTIICHVMCLTDWFSFPEVKLFTKDYTVECNAKGEWNSELPHCIKAKGFPKMKASQHAP